ncbi:hypothetical protein [Nocardioides sp. SLBN-35]|uniref:hypothetical protein n=1 Tax=Nocardioides sp. SLBN-35 TaxID=2768445 RepID=UPI00115479BA|nr:hypothetical protein [Nocardioides sp. SLBN-35]TQK72599.1 hypothetical protein FBY23_4416 [Nocardioides sp. SLBN-35]
MTSCYDIGCQVGAKASELIDGTPPGYVTIGGSYADIGPSFSHYDDLPVGTLDGSRTSLSTALNSVAVPGQGSSDVLDTGVVTPNQAFANMARINPDVLNWTGDAAIDFNDNYNAQLPYVADSNFTGISVLAAAVEAQKELYTFAKDSILDIGNKTLSALEAADGRGGASGAFALTVLAAVGTVAVTVLTAGTGTAATVAITIAVASGAASSGAAATALPFGGDSPEDIMDDFYSAVGKVEEHVRTRQQEISNGLRDFAAAVHQDIDQTHFAEDVYPRFKFKPTGFAQGPGGLGGWDG